ncbi:MAG: hypothetical protein QNJ98_06990 [Planctomycetota bacterium]|nr:hypothetical protein [Planctomycetota bacterium]
MTRPILASTCLLAALALLLVPGPAADAGEGWWGDLDKGQVVELADIMAEPTRFTNRQLTFTCVTGGKANVFFQESAIVSRQRYTNYAVWPDGAVVWQRQDYVGKDFPFLFIGKSHFQHDELLGLRKYTRIEVTGRIKAILRNKPHIEVSSWRPTSHRLGGLVVDAMLRGDRFAEAGEWDIAVERYKEALRPDLPPKYALVIRKQLSAVLRQLGRNEEAAQVEDGGILSPDDFDRKRKPGVIPDTPAFPPATTAPGAGPDGAPPAGTSPPPIEDQLPGTPINPPVGTGPMASGGLDTPAEPSKPRGERANPFLDEDLPGMAARGTQREPEFAPVGRNNAPLRRPEQPGGNGFPAPVPETPAPRVVRPAPATPQPAPAPFGPGSDDMPGQPVNPAPATPPPGAAPVAPQPPVVAPAADDPTQPTREATPRTPRGRPILPPKRRPRLAGVK